ncbi:SpoIIE family protein phosphatase [Acidobacteriia bacterium AH_259_A11_L15]|nr:SpoIIE family protein phosphatase [Acidobacteriia bacterium AH_259_A11_L15]
MKDKGKDNPVSLPGAQPGLGAAPANLAEARELLAEQSRTLARLQFLVEASKVLNSTLDLPELLGIILKMASENTGADRGSLFLVDHQRQQLWSLLAHGLERKEIRLPMGQGIAGAVAQTGEVVNLEDAYSDPRFDREFDQRFGYRTHSLLCLPIKDRDEKIVGVLQLLNKRDGSFRDEDLEFLQGLSVHAAIALENARLHLESVERQRLERELSLARNIQAALLPEKPPALDAFEVAVRHESSLQVSGDYYDFLFPTADSFVFVVSDVEGKGVGASLIMSNLQASLRAIIMQVHSLEGVLYSLNESLVVGARSKKFMTFFLGLMDQSGRGLHYVNAGHVPPVLVRKHGEPVFLKEGGMVLGLFPHQRYQRGFEKLEPGDVILACTDGITEAANPQEEQYESERIIQVAQTNRQRSAQEIVEAIFADVAAFERGGTHQDDKVMMALKVR